MMVVMTPKATEAEIEAVTAKLETTGVHVVVMPGELTTAIGAIGDPEGVAELGLEGMAGVDRVVPISRPYKLASSELSHHEPTVLEIGGRTVGGGSTFCLIAGPCTVESAAQTLEVARAVEQGGASMLRGGAFKPRTSPFAFKGLGVEALEILAEARAATGLPVVTELLDTGHAEAIAEHADVVQIGARNMQNYAPARGRRQARQAGPAQARPLLHARRAAAGGRLRAQGGQRAVILCERGIRTFETATRFTLDLGAVPVAEAAHPPAGDRRPVARRGRPPPGRAARRAPRRPSAPTGSSSRSHQDPEAALCDGPQPLYARTSPASRATSLRTPSCSAVRSPERAPPARGSPASD